MTLNVPAPNPVKAYGIELPMTDQFTCQGSIVRVDGGAENDIRNRLNKARNVMQIMSNIWRSAKCSVKTKLKLFNACVLSTFLYGSECWWMTKSNAKKLSAFYTTCLRKILRIFWPIKLQTNN